MSRELIVLRHAEAVPANNMLGDADRPLSPAGEAAARRVGHALGAAAWLPDQVLVSPARRAAQTAEAIAEVLKLPALSREPRLYEADLATLLALLGAAPAAARTLLVGHNPGLERLLAHLLPGRRADTGPLTLAPAGMVRLRLPAEGDPLRPGGGTRLPVLS